MRRRTVGYKSLSTYTYIDNLIEHLKGRTVFRDIFLFLNNLRGNKYRVSIKSSTR